MTLLCMSQPKIEHYVLLTPYLQELQTQTSDLVVVIPDDHYAVYAEQKIFKKFISVEKARQIMCSTKDVHVLDLTYPLLKNKNIPEFYARLPESFFNIEQPLAQSYRQALDHVFQTELKVNMYEPKTVIELERYNYELTQTRDSTRRAS